MTLEFSKKYEIVKSVIDNFKDKAFTIGELYIICDEVSRKYNIVLQPQDVICIVIDLYDSFDLNREVSKEGVVRYKNNILGCEMPDTISGRH